MPVGRSSNGRHPLPLSGFRTSDTAPTCVGRRAHCGERRRVVILNISLLDERWPPARSLDQLISTLDQRAINEPQASGGQVWGFPQGSCSRIDEYEQSVPKVRPWDSGPGRVGRLMPARKRRVARTIPAQARDLSPPFRLSYPHHRFAVVGAPPELLSRTRRGTGNRQQQNGTGTSSSKDRVFEG